MPLTVAELKVVLDADTAAMDAALKAAPARAAAAAEEVGKRWQSAGASMTRVGAMLTAGITAPVVLAGRAALKAAGEFEQAMNVFAAGSHASAREMDQARKLAIALGNDMKLPGTSASDAARAMLELSQHGLKVRDVFAATRGVLQLSAAGHMSNAAAAKITASTLNAFRLEGSKAVQVADMLASAHLSSGSAMSKLGFAIRNGAAVFATAKIPLADFATSIAILARNGIEGQRAGTGLATALQKLLAPGAEGAKAIARLGIHLYDANKQMLPWPAILEQIRGKLAGLSLEQRNDEMKRLFGTGSSFSAAAVLLQAGAAGFDHMKAKMEQQGTAARLAEAQMKGYKGALDQFNSAIDTAYISLASRFLPAITQLINRGSELISRFAALPVSTQNTILSFVAAAAALGPLVIVTGQFVSAIGAILSAGPALGAALAALTGPVGLIAAGIAALGLAWATNFGNIRGVTMQIVAAVLPPLKSLWNELRQTAQVYLPILRQAFTAFVAWVEPYWRAAFTLIGAVVRGAVTLISGLLTAFLRAMRGDWHGAWEAVKATMRALVPALRQIFEAWLQWMRAWFAGTIGLALQFGHNLIEGLINGIRERIGAARSAIQGVGTAIVGTFKAALGISSPSRVFQKHGQEIAEGLILGLASRYTSVREATNQMIGYVMNATSQAQLRLREEAGRLRAEMRDLRAGSEYERFALRFEGAAPADIRRVFNEAQSVEAKRGKMETERAAARELREELESLNLAQLRLLATTEAERLALDKFKMPLADLSAEARRAVLEFVSLKNAMEEMGRVGRAGAIRQASDVIAATKSGVPEMDITSPGWKNKPGPNMGDRGLAKLPEDAAEAKARRIKETLRDAGEVFNSVLGRSIEALKERGIKGFFQSLTQGITQSIQSVLMELAKSAALRSLGIGGAGSGGGLGGLGALGGALGGALPWVAGGLALNSVLGNPLKKVGKILGFADGGRPPLGVPSLVGERGPELFVPDRPGTIVPAEQARGGNATVNNYFYGNIQHEADEKRLTNRITEGVQQTLRFV